MIEAKAVTDTAFFMEVRDSVVFIRDLQDIAGMLPVGGREFVAVPSPKTIAGRLERPVEDVVAGLRRLMDLKWVRKHREGSRVAYVLGTPDRLFMRAEIEKRYRGASRRKDGAVALTEWRWVPLERWRAVTLWEMLREKLEERGVRAPWAGAAKQARLQALCDEVGMEEARRVAVFMAERYEELKKAFNWYGRPSVGLFCGYFHSIAEAASRGMPSQRPKASHDRIEKDDEAWRVL